MNGDANGVAGLGRYRLEFVWVQPTNEEEETAALKARSAAALAAVTDGGGDGDGNGEIGAMD